MRLPMFGGFRDGDTCEVVDMTVPVVHVPVTTQVQWSDGAVVVPSFEYETYYLMQRGHGRLALVHQSIRRR